MANFYRGLDLVYEKVTESFIERSYIIVAYPIRVTFNKPHTTGNKVKDTTTFFTKIITFRYNIRLSLRTKR